jgi:DNA invertase Pin-like site-specific DNA recombinase
MGRLLGYARVSSTDQDTALQIEQLYSAGCEKVWAEKRSGKEITKRVELAACLDFAESGDVILFTRLDRLARSVVDLWRIVDQAQAKGVHLKCLHQPFTTDTPHGKLFFTMLGAFAEFENDIRRERQREGIERAKARGVYAQRRFLLGERAKRILELKKQGYLPTDIIEEMSLGGTIEQFSASHRRPLYGKWPWGRDPEWVKAASERYGADKINALCKADGLIWVFGRWCRPCRNLWTLAARRRRSPKYKKMRSAAHARAMKPVLDARKAELKARLDASALRRKEARKELTKQMLAEAASKPPA